MRPHRSVPLPLLLVLACYLPLPASEIATCPGLAEEERKACFETSLGDPAALRASLDDLRRLYASSPADVLEALEFVVALETLPPELAAAVWDLRGLALLATDRARDAANAFDRALALDDGTTRVRWVGTGGQLQRESSIDVGSGRLVRAARAAAAADRPDRAAALMNRALALGARRDLLDGISPGPEATPLFAEPWYRPLPDLPIPVFDGDPWSISDARGRVVLLDFWATWCGPCADELPHLQALWEAERERGLVAVAVNNQEPREIALPYARALGLTMPIGRYTGEMDRIYRVREVPTLILVDQEGRIRERWNGYYPGLEEDVALKARSLLDPSRAADPGLEIARVLVGAGRLRVNWMRELEANLVGLTIVDVPAGGERILAGVGSRLVLYGSDGMTVRRWDWPRKIGQLRRGDRVDDGGYWLAAFRPGGSAVHLRRLPDGEPETVETATPVLDVEVTDALHGPGQGLFLVATLGGLERRVATGWESLPGFGETLSLVSAGYGEAARTVVLGSTPSGTPRVAWLDRNLQVVYEIEPPPGVSGLVVDPDRPEGVGLTPLAVVAAVSGRFAADGTQTAFATSDQLVLFDPDSDEERFRARWEGITDLAAGDLDGDGRDELIVAAGRRLTVLGWSK